MATLEELQARQQRAREAAASSIERGGSSLEALQRRVDAARRAQVAPIPEPQGMPEEFGPARTARGVGQLGLAALEGATLGLADEAGALGKTIAGQLGVEGQSPSFSENLAQTGQVMEDIPSGVRVVGNLAGGAGLGSAFRAPQTIGQAALQAAVPGAVAGAGFSTGGLAERAAGAGAGALTGAALGAGGQGLIQGVGRVIARLRQGVDNKTAKALDRVLQEMDAGDITPQQAIKRVERLGPEGVLADVPALQRLSQQAASQTAAGNRIAQSAIERRAALAPQRVDAAMDVAFAGGTLREARKALARAQQVNATPLYEKALSGGPLQRTQALDDLIGVADEAGKVQGGSSEIVNAIRKLRASNPRLRGLADTDPRLLHQVRVRLAEKTKGPGRAKANINDVVQQLTDAMDEAGATGYRDAVSQYRSDSLSLEAFDRGRKALNELPENIETFLKNAPQGEREAFVAGLGRQVLRDLEPGATGNVPQNIRKIFRGERADVLREALGPEGFKAFRNRLLREIEFAKTANRTLGGSPTQPRQAAAAEQFNRLNRLTRAGAALREGRGLISAGVEGVRGAQPAGANVEQNRALAQLLFRSQGQGLGAQRFGPAQTPLTELALRQRLLQGAGGVGNLVRGPAAAGSGVGGGLAASGALSGVEF